MKGELRNIGGTNTTIAAVFGNVAYPMSIIVKVPASSGTVYLGGSGVNTSTNGFPLAAGESLEVDLVNEQLYAVTTVTTTVYILRRGD